MLRAQDVGPNDLDGGDGTDSAVSSDPGPGSEVRAEVHVAGCLAYVGAEAKSNKTRGEYRRCISCANEWEVSEAPAEAVAV